MTIEIEVARMDERVKAMERVVQKVADAQAEVGRAITMMAGLEQRLAAIESQGRTVSADNRRAVVSGAVSFAVGLAVAGVVAYFKVPAAAPAPAAPISSKAATGG